ncbi:MAG: DUF389 domain-containing protein [Polyangiaceae bacterium]|nr:DUF389 domain-containing protein [Polyangiaceae bacterium]
MKTVEAVRALQDRLASLLGCEPKSRADVIASMLQRTPREIFGYWLQLSIAAGIALLGLVLGSTAVIIGAMLVAPLMGPIVGLGMGLAAGSTVLVLRAAGRVLGSVAVVVAIGAGLTKVIPFHEINAEIAARTTPTALDLGIAVFCAMAGVFATLRPSSDVASTAAGTSIGISLVPPLCVSGYGLGTSAAPIAVGAALLFLTNLAAIIFVSTLSFAAIGFRAGGGHPPGPRRDSTEGAVGSCTARSRAASPRASDGPSAAGCASSCPSSSSVRCTARCAAGSIESRGRSRPEAR